MKDPNKLRNVAMQYTSWASNLALASVFADAEAVKFDPTKSTTSWGGNRANYFAKRMRSNLLSGGMGGASSLVALIIEEVDVKELNVGVNGGPTSRVVTTAVTSQILDANTHTTKTTATTHNSSNNKAKSATTRHTKVASAVGVDEDITTLSTSEEVSLKKRAKGFIPGGGDEATLMMGMRTIVA
jgi:Tfp pilus assembly major pilin PilA